VKYHAVERAMERLRLTDQEARLRLRRAFVEGVPLPWRIARDLRLLSSRGNSLTRRRKSFGRLKTHGALVIAYHGQNVVTCWCLTLDQLAALLVWHMTGRCT